MAALASACGDQNVARAGFEVRDSAGVSIAVSQEPAWSPGAGWIVGDRQFVVGGGGIDLFRVSAAVRLPDRRIVVADEGTSLIHFFDPVGRLEATGGGEGDGPGEFRIIQAIGSAGGDTVWVYDFSHRRLTTYRRPGEVDRSMSLQPALATAALVGWSGDGYVATQLWGEGSGRSSFGLVRNPVTFVNYDAQGVLRDTIGSFPGREVLLRPEGERVVMGVAPFTRTASYALGAGVLFVGDQVTHEVRSWELDGGLVAIIRWTGGSLEVTDQDVAEWKTRQVESAASVDQPSVRAYLTDVPVPDRRPAYGPLLVGAGGYLWVGAYEYVSQAPSFWDVFDVRGRWLGSVEMPLGFRPLQIGEDWVLGVTRDELDVERVEVRTLIRAPGAFGGP